MSMIYFISVISLLISGILMKKSEKKLDIVKTIVVSVVLLLCYNTLISFVFTYTHIPINLYTLSGINSILSIIMIGKILYQKRIQTFSFDKKDLVYIIVLLIVILIISYFDFGFPLDIKYLTTDSSIHYISAREFYENESLLSIVKDINTANAMMPGAYSNIGILFKAFAPMIGEMNLYQVFIGFDITVLFLAGLLFYLTIKKYAKSKLALAIAGIVSMIYLLGYPLNNLLFGYFYLGIGIIVVNTILMIMQDFEEFLGKKIRILLLFLLCFELFFSYYLFTPAIYGAMFIFYLFYFKKKHGKWINKECILYTVITLIIPTIFGFCYHVLPGMLSQNEIQVGSVIQVEGYIYRNLYSNLLLFVPFVIYYLAREAKEKKIHFDVIQLIILLLYMCVLYIGIFKLNISTYYFFKTYFILWQVIIYLFYRGICYVLEEKKYGKYLVSSYLTIYIAIMIISLLFHQVPIIKDRFNENEKITDVMDIYGINKTILFGIEKDYNQEELKILNYVKENKLELKNNNTLLIANQRQEFWFWAMLEYRYKTILEMATTTKHVQAWNDGEYQYLIYFNRSYNYEKYQNQLNLEQEVIYQNEAGAILKHK